MTIGFEAPHLNGKDGEKYYPPEGMMWVAVRDDGTVKPITQYATRRLPIEEAIRSSWPQWNMRVETAPLQDIENLPVGQKPFWINGALEIIDAPERVRADRVVRAKMALAATDFVVAKAFETSRKLSTEWQDWRQLLRDIINGLDADIPPEPGRWAGRSEEPSPTPLPPNPEFVKLTDYIPSEIAKLMEEGETVPQAKQRLFQLLGVEEAELKQAIGLKGENLNRLAEVQFLLGLLARLGDS